MNFATDLGLDHRFKCNLIPNKKVVLAEDAYWKPKLKFLSIWTPNISSALYVAVELYIRKKNNVSNNSWIDTMWLWIYTYKGNVYVLQNKGMAHI